ncbi:MAG: pyruvate kinase [bacterium]
MFLIATVGYHNTGDKTRKLVLAGADAIRFNFSRRSIEENIDFAKTSKDIIASLNASTKIMIDLPINKIRLGDFSIKTFAVRENEIFTCQSATYSPDCNEFIPVNTGKIGEKVYLNQTITLGDGEIALQVVDIINSDTIKVKVMNNGVVEYMRTFNINNNDERIEELIDNYTKISEKIAIIDPDFIAFSYISASDNETVKKIFYSQKERGRPKIIIKIENQNAINDLDQILSDSFYDIIMIDRGEFGVNIPYQKLGTLQKEITEQCVKAGKPLFISTQILESTINNFMPSRAEILGITNMVMDGVRGLIFCKETGYNTRPAYTISVAKKIIEETEKYKRQANKTP